MGAAHDLPQFKVIRSNLGSMRGLLYLLVAALLLATTVLPSVSASCVSNDCYAIIADAAFQEKNDALNATWEEQNVGGAAAVCAVHTDIFCIDDEAWWAAGIAQDFTWSTGVRLTNAAWLLAWNLLP